MQRIKVATLNIWNRMGPWPERLRLIREQLAELNPDVIGLQEVLRLGSDRPDYKPGPENDQASAIGDGMPYQIAYAAAADYGSGLFMGNALLSRFSILETRSLRLPDEGSGETRVLLYARLDTPFGELPMFVTHLNWKLHHGSVRLRQVQFIAERIAELAPIDDRPLPPVLMGDLNADPDSDEIRYLKGLHTLDNKSVFFADAWQWAGDGTPGYTFDPRNCFARRSHEPPRRIDYIFVRGPDRNLRGEPLSASLAFCKAGDQPRTAPPLGPSEPATAAHAVQTAEAMQAAKLAEAVDAAKTPEDKHAAQSAVAAEAAQVAESTSSSEVSASDLWPSDHFGLSAELAASPRTL